MKTLTLLLALTLGMSACGMGGNSEQALTSELSSRLQQFYTASAKGDTDAMNKILADDFAFSPASGVTITKAQTMTYKPREGYTYTVTLPAMVTSTSDEAVLNYTENTKNGETQVVAKKQTAFFKKRDGQWQITTLRAAAS